MTLSAPGPHGRVRALRECLIGQQQRQGIADAAKGGGTEKRQRGGIGREYTDARSRRQPGSENHAERLADGEPQGGAEKDPRGIWHTKVGDNRDAGGREGKQGKHDIRRPWRGRLLDPLCRR